MDAYKNFCVFSIFGSVIGNTFSGHFRLSSLHFASLIRAGLYDLYDVIIYNIYFKN